METVGDQLARYTQEALDRWVFGENGAVEQPDWFPIHIWTQLKSVADPVLRSKLLGQPSVDSIRGSTRKDRMAQRDQVIKEMLVIDVYEGMTTESDRNALRFCIIILFECIQKHFSMEAYSSLNVELGRRMRLSSIFFDESLPGDVTLRLSTVRAAHKDLELAKVSKEHLAKALSFVITS